ncbi:DUF305 domain-containing protein [Microbacterium yannicii]|uniref:DUF305 domain-containing protein n=1 Tax=Microbacterium yannicii TaxID=671622 RepID=UPI0002EEBAC9|nr:DUF305 domain-containing protein [Microbacterium yannicii]
MRRPFATAVSLAAFLVTGALAVGVQLSPSATATESPPAPDGAGAVFAAAQQEEPVDDVPNEADMGFAAMMIPHHQQAIELSQILAGTPGIGDASTSLAVAIERDQAAEVAQMQAWIDAWHQVGILDHDHSGTMSGMATPEQIAELRDLSGPEAEKRFLELMIFHHEGALDMARTAMAAGHNSFIRALAKHVAAEQQREIEAMTARLGTL